MHPTLSLIVKELAHLGAVTERQAVQIAGRLASAGYKGPIAWQPTETAGLWTLAPLDETAWGPPPAARALAVNERVRGPKQAPVSISGADLSKLSALACRLEREAGEGG